MRTRGIWRVVTGTSRHATVLLSRPLLSSDDGTDEQAEAQRDRAEEEESQGPVHSLCGPPNGSLLSCGRSTRWRKALERQTKRLASEATQLFLTCERPSASSAC